MRLSSNSTTQARCQIVAEHIARENQHSLDGILATFGEAPRYDDEPWDAHYVGLQGVRTFYTQLLQALPDLHIDVIRQHVAEHVIVVEVITRGRHMGSWRGLPATGRRIEFPLCGIYTFDRENRLAGEKIYYDRAIVLRQLGIFHEPESIRGRLATAAMHPVFMARTLVHNIATLWRRS
jgi:steroid delta-isomerase-like uncharacterized protein